MRGRIVPEEEIAFGKSSTTQFPIFHRLRGPSKSILDVHGFIQAVANHEISAHEPHTQQPQISVLVTQRVQNNHGMHAYVRFYAGSTSGRC